MATGLSRPLARSLKGRTMSIAAAQADKKGPDEREPKAYVKKLNNGMLVGTCETKSPVARVAVVASAGARFESGDNLGITHCLRHVARLRTENLSSLGITRSSAQLGSDITCQAAREYLVYQSGVTRNCAPKMIEILSEMTTKHVFKDWELADLQRDPNAMKLDLAVVKQQPQVRLMELLHAAAFRDTLGRSLYAPSHMIGKYNSEQLTHYVKNYFSAGRLALVGVGMDHLELEDLASEFEPYEAVNVPAKAASFQGGELRHNTGGDLSFVAFALGGPSQYSKDLLPSEILRHIMGIGPVIKYSKGTATSQLGKAAAQNTDAPFAVSSLNANYSDAGMFGFNIITHNSEIEKVSKAVANQFRSVLTNGVSDQDVSRAKTQLKAEIAMLFEHPDNLLFWLGEQTIHCDHILTPHEVYNMVDPITTADVNNVAKKIATSKAAMAVTGNTNNVPYLDKLIS